MKALSSSVVVLSGALLLAAAMLGHGDVQTFSQVVGVAILAAGLFGWWRALSKEDHS